MLKLRLALAAFVFAGSGLTSTSSLSAQDAEGTTPAIDQLPASTYVRAEAVIPQHIGRLIYGTSVRPRWIGETSRFQFEKRTPEGRQYLVVDAVAGTMQPLFDHEALINALAAATDKPVERKKLDRKSVV